MLCWFLVYNSVNQTCCCCGLAAKSFPTLCHPVDCSPSGQEYWSELPFPSPTDLPHSGTELVFPALQVVYCLSGRFFTAEPPGKPQISYESTYVLSLLSLLLTTTTTLFPCLTLWVVTEHQAELPALYSNFPLAIFLCMGMCFSAALSVHPTLSYHCSVHKSVLYV